jgi:ketosteroid isomerase-like protein
MKKRRLTTLLYSIVVLLSILTSCKNTNEKVISDFDDIKQMMQDYRQAWRNGDSTIVLDKLTNEIILFQPGKNGKPILSKNDVSEFWFPKSDIKYPIIKYEVENEEIVSSGNIAYYQGVSRLTWCTLENNIGRDTILSVSEFTNILKKEDGKWKIHRIMYNLKDSKYNR